MKKPKKLALKTGPSDARLIFHSLISAGPAMLAFNRSNPSAIIASKHQNVSQKWYGRSLLVSIRRLTLISFIILVSSRQCRLREVAGSLACNPNNFNAVLIEQVRNGSVTSQTPTGDFMLEV